MHHTAIWYVGTLSRYALVSAKDADDARRRGWRELYALYSDLRERLGREVPINILTVRPATAEEIELQKWHGDMSGLVDSEDGCPLCGERGSDLLIWIDDEEVQCHGCGHVYQPSPGSSSDF